MPDEIPQGNALMARVAREALALCGTPFRLHGRCARGLDCVGLAGLALERAGHKPWLPEGYRLRGGDPRLFARWLAAAGLRRVRKAKVGDLMLVRAGPAQFHLLVLTQGGFVHADAGIGRVVEVPGPLLWPVVSMWRVGR